ncbi:MAG: archease, partial [Candidatus Omnitrophica bacterium]|nr:archease [Candidatus Omnitrophota bacterium]
LIADLKKVSSKDIIFIEAKAQDVNELLRNWLAELLYYFNAKDIIFCDFKIIKLTDNYIKSQATGEKLDKNKHTLFHEIKAVTFHGLNIEKQKNILTAEIIFDI